MKIPHRLLVTAAAVPLILALVACGGGSKNKSPTGSSAGNNQPAATVSSGNNGSASTGSSGSSASNSNSGGNSSASGDVLAKVITNFASAKSWKAEIKDESDPTANGSFEYVAPNKIHLTSAQFEVIQIANDTYVKIGGSWTKAPGGSGNGPLINPDDLKSTIDQAKSANVTKGGKDNVNGKECQLYTYKEPDASGNTEVCVASDLPVRIVEDNGGSKTTVTFTDFNSNFDIKAPI